MVNALKSCSVTSQSVLLHQLLHGYADGHRLIESSFKPQDDLTRLMLRMSDLSGSSMVSGFEEYLTGYPLSSINAYALAKTWYAPEMPRPGCVWTHTIVISSPVLEELSNLRVLASLFRRPGGNLKGSYSSQIELGPHLAASHLGNEELLSMEKTQRILKCFYENFDRCLLIPTVEAKDCEKEILAIWSQQWPSMRETFTFCTGSLSSRTYSERPLDIQCVPKSLLHEMTSEVTAGRAQPLIIDSAELPSDSNWSFVAARDALSESATKLRIFLWSAADRTSGRKDFVQLVEIFERIKQSRPVSDLVKLVADTFLDKDQGAPIKKTLFGPPENRGNMVDYAEQEILSALGTTDSFESFDAEALRLRERGERFPKAYPEGSRQLLGELFRSANPLGEMILVGLISGLDPQSARYVTAQQPQFLPALFRAKPSLACSPELWEAAGSQKWELLESLATNEDLDSKLIGCIVGAILDSGSENLLRRAVTKWGKSATFGALDWVEVHHGKMSEDCRMALTFQDRFVADWVTEGQSRSLPSVIAAAHVVAPYAYRLWDQDYAAWLKAFRNPHLESDKYESTYLCTFLLALALGNAPPKAIALISETFERVHAFFQTAHEVRALEKVADECWVIMDPIVPHLKWRHEWDKCERLRRGLAQAFVKHGWPATELNNCIRDNELFAAFLKSAKRVDGGEGHFQIVIKGRS